MSNHNWTHGGLESVCTQCGVSVRENKTGPKCPTPSAGAAPASEPPLSELLEKARHHVMTDEEREAQRQSWVSGELGISAAERAEGCATTRFPPSPAVPQETEAERIEHVRNWFFERNKHDLLPHEIVPNKRRYPSGIGTSDKLFMAIAEYTCVAIKEALASKGCSDCQAELESMSESLASSSARVEELARALARESANREVLHSKFGPHIGEDGHCHCAYCEKDFEAVAEHAADMECQCFLPQGWKDRAESAEAQLTLVRKTLPKIDECLQGLENGIDTEEMHCEPLPVTSSWLYVTQQARKRLAALLDKLKPAADQPQAKESENDGL